MVDIFVFVYVIYCSMHESEEYLSVPHRHKFVSYIYIYIYTVKKHCNINPIYNILCNIVHWYSNYM